jgi:hypothetical protein
MVTDTIDKGKTQWVQNQQRVLKGSEPMVPASRFSGPQGGRGLLLALPLLWAGCASYNARPFIESGGASTLVDHRQFEGLHLAVEDLSPPRISLKHFDRDLKSHGFLPVMVRAELDARSSTAFHLRREELELCLPDGTRIPAADPLDVIEAVSFSHWRSVFGFCFILPGFFVVHSVNTANEKLESDYLAKSFRSVRLSPNLRAYAGTVFFRVPDEVEDALRLEDAFVEVAVQIEGQDHKAMGRRGEFPVHFSR